MFERIARMLNDTAQHLKSQQTKSGFLPQRKKEVSHERKEYSQQKKELSHQKKEYSQQIHGRKDRIDCNNTIKDFNDYHDRRQDEQKKWDNKDDDKNLPSSLFSPITEKSKECGDIMSVVNREEDSFQPFIDNNFGNSYDSDRPICAPSIALTARQSCGKRRHVTARDPCCSYSIRSGAGPMSGALRRAWQRGEEGT